VCVHVCVCVRVKGRVAHHCPPQPPRPLPPADCLQRVHPACSHHQTATSRLPAARAPSLQPPADCHQQTACSACTQLAATARTQAPHPLTRGLDVRKHVRGLDAHARRHLMGRALAVAGQHDAAHALALEVGDGAARIQAQRVLRGMGGGVDGRSDSKDGWT